MPFRPPSSSLPAERILVRATNWIGDLVMISPALEAARRAWPAARITLLVRRHLADAMAAHPAVDEILSWDHRGRHARPLGTLRLARELARHRFDLALLLPRSFESALVARLAGIPRIAGWKADGRGLLITHGRRRTAEDRTRHHVHQFLEVVRFAGAPVPEDPVPRFYLRETDRTEAAELLGPEGAATSFLLVVSPGASKLPRAWHPRRFAAVARALVEPRGGFLALVGSTGDRQACGVIRRAAGVPSVNLAGKTRIPQMAALLERAHLFLGNDSGPMHVAAALGTPHVAVFGPGSPSRTAPLLPGGAGTASLSRAVTLDLPCSPCRQDFFRECRPGPWGKPWCLEDLTVEHVLREAEELLGVRHQSSS